MAKKQASITVDESKMGTVSFKYVADKEPNDNWSIGQDIMVFGFSPEICQTSQLGGWTSLPAGGMGRVHFPRRQVLLLVISNLPTSGIVTSSELSDQICLRKRAPELQRLAAAGAVVMPVISGDQSPGLWREVVSIRLFGLQEPSSFQWSSGESSPSRITRMAL